MTPTFFPTPADFRSWLEKHHDQQTELWVGYYKKGTKKASIDWPQSVDQALCFGWIDGLRKSIDAESYMIRFTPRRPTSHWSAVNINRMPELIAKGLVTPPGQAAFDKLSDKRSKQFAYEQKDQATKLPTEFEQQIKANKKAWEFFEALPPSAKKPTIWWVISAKQEVTQLRRLATLIQCSEEGLRIPMIRRRPSKK